MNTSGSKINCHLNGYKIFTLKDNTIKQNPIIVKCPSIPVSYSWFRKNVISFVKMWLSSMKKTNLKMNSRMNSSTLRSTLSWRPSTIVHLATVAATFFGNGSLLSTPSLFWRRHVAAPVAKGATVERRVVGRD